MCAKLLWRIIRRPWRIFLAESTPFIPYAVAVVVVVVVVVVVAVVVVVVAAVFATLLAYKCEVQWWWLG